MDEAGVRYRQGQLDAAEKICTRVLKARRDQFDALHLLGLLKLAARQGRGGAALLAGAQAQSRSPQVLVQPRPPCAALNRDDEALASLDRALALAPATRGAQQPRQRAARARPHGRSACGFERVLALEPRYLGARVNRGNALAQLGRSDEALAHYDARARGASGACRGATTIAPMRCASLGRAADALAGYDRALALRADYGKARTTAAWRLRRSTAIARRWRTTANALAPTRQRRCAFQRGAVAADARRLSPRLRRIRVALEAHRHAARKASASRSGSANIRSRARPSCCMPSRGWATPSSSRAMRRMLARGGAKVVLEVQPELNALLSGFEGVTAVVARGEPLPPFDVHCPLGSLPLACRPTLVERSRRTFPISRPSEERVAKWRARLERAAGPRIALAWSGSADHANDRNRSIALARLAPLFAAGRASFVSIQRELRAGDADALARVPHTCTHVGDELADFADTAAVLALADLVISRRHLGGASRRRAWAGRCACCCRSSRTGAGCSIARTSPGIRTRGCSASPRPATGTA